jgi:hypothetical protein
MDEKLRQLACGAEDDAVLLDSSGTTSAFCPSSRVASSTIVGVIGTAVVWTMVVCSRVIIAGPC